MKIVIDKYPENCTKCIFGKVESNHIYGGNTEYYSCTNLPHAKKGNAFKYRRRNNCPLVEYKELEGE